MAGRGTNVLAKRHAKIRRDSIKGQHRVVGHARFLGDLHRLGLDAGLLPEPDRFADLWRLERRFTPGMAESERSRKIAGWRDAVRRTLSTG